jgi:hypothetical protein
MTDLAVWDLAVWDLAVWDLAVWDLAVWDLAVWDLAVDIINETDDLLMRVTRHTAPDDPAVEHIESDEQRGLAPAAGDSSAAR